MNRRDVKLIDKGCFLNFIFNINTYISVTYTDPLLYILYRKVITT